MHKNIFMYEEKYLGKVTFCWGSKIKGNFYLFSKY